MGADVVKAIKLAELRRRLRSMLDAKSGFWTIWNEVEQAIKKSYVNGYLDGQKARRSDHREDQGEVRP